MGSRGLVRALWHGCVLWAGLPLHLWYLVVVVGWSPWRSLTTACRHHWGLWRWAWRLARQGQ